MADKHDDTRLSEAEVEDLFAAARARRPEPSDALMQRVLEGAEAGLASAAPLTLPRPGPLRRILEEIGGWPAAAGLAAATAAGVFIGLATPETLESLSAGYLSTGGLEAADLLPSYAALLGEG